MSDDGYTKYERARLMGARSLQIALGAPIMVESKPDDEPIDIAKRELKEDALPLTVRRTKERRKPRFLEA